MNVTKGGNFETERKAYYTGFNINATKTSRTAISTNLPLGAVLVRDPYGHDRGVGQDFTQPQTSFLHEQKVIVIEVPPGSVRGGPIRVVNYSELVPAYTQANMTAGTTILGPVNGSFALNALPITSVAEVAAILRTGCSLAMETVDTSVTAAVKNVRHGLYSNVS